MAEYIDRKRLMDDISKYSIESYSGLIRSVVMKQPEADVVEVVHGKWKFGGFDVLGESVQCSVCGWGAEYANKKAWLEFPGHKYCGNCGAKMDGGTP